MTAEFFIYSNHHKAWWGANGSGYYTGLGSAGRYAEADTAQWLTRGCYCRVVPEVLVPVPDAEVLAKVLTNPEAATVWSRPARGVATRKAKREGRINKHATAARA